MTEPGIGHDGLLIHPGETRTALNGLTDAAGTLDGAWQAAKSACQPGSNLGNGPMGAAFQKAISSASAACAKNGPVDSISACYREAHKTGADAVNRYEAAEAEATGAFTLER